MLKPKKINASIKKYHNLTTHTHTRTTKTTTKPVDKIIYWSTSPEHVVCPDMV